MWFTLEKVAPKICGTPNKNFSIHAMLCKHVQSFLCSVFSACYHSTFRIKKCEPNNMT